MSKIDTHSGPVAWFARNPVAANLLMALILVAGLMSAMNLRVEAFPPLPPNSVTVSVPYDSGSARNAETGIALKIEEALQGVEGIKSLSVDADGSGVNATVERTSGYDLETLYQDIKARIDGLANLPLSAERPVVTKERYLEDAVSVQVYGQAPARELQEVARLLRKQLLNNSAIERVNTNGRRVPEMVIEVDEAKLQALDLSLADIAAKVRSSSLIEAGGELFSASGRLIIKADQQATFQRQFEQILVVQRPSGERITLGELAVVTDGFAQSPVLSRFNGVPAIGLDVKMYGRSDIMSISQQVAKEVAEFRPQLPQGIEIAVWNDQSGYIADRLSLLLYNSLLGMALVMLLLALFLNLRVALWVGVGLPVVFCGALLLMDARLFDLTLNELTTFGFIIALGIVVDDAVVVGESIHTSQQRHGASLEATIEGAKRVSLPTVFGVMTTIVAFMALTLVEGEMGTIFSFFAYAAAFCLVFSLLESKFILPAHLAHPGKPANNRVSRAWGRLQSALTAGLDSFTQRIYRPLLQAALVHRYASLVFALALFTLVFGLVPSGRIGAVFFPDIPSNYISVQMTLEDDAGFGLVQRQARIIEQAAEQYNRQALEQGQPQAPIQHLAMWTDDRQATLVAQLSPRSSRSLGTQQIANAWQQQIPALEGLRQLKMVTSWEGAEDISIELRAEQQQLLLAASDQLRQALAQYPGVGAIQSSLRAGQGQVDLVLTAAGEALGLSAKALAEQVQQGFQGLEIQRFQRGNDEIKVTIQYPESARRGLDNLAQARIRTADGQVLPLSHVARLETRFVAKNIYRVDGSRVAVVSADVDKSQASPQQVLDDLESGLFQQLRRDYPGLEIVLAGEAREEAQTRQSLQGAFLVALLAIYALLAIPLSSYWQPLVIMMAIPFGIVGALLGHWLHAIPLSILSLFGILALSGVVVNDSLLLINRYNTLRASGLAVQQALVEAGCGRLRAIFLTSITTYAGLVPLIFETSEQAQFLIPAAIAMGYGILFATVITLLLIPALTCIGEDFKPASKAEPLATAASD